MAKEIICRWTGIYAEKSGIVLLPINWESNSYPEQGLHPQKVLNNQLVAKSDLLIGIFGARVGTPTDTSKSGTIEEVEEHIKDGKPVMLFFRRYNDTSYVPSSELERLESFKRTIENRCLYKEYSMPSDFERVFTDALENFLNNNWLKSKEQSVKLSSTVEFSDNELEILRLWASSDNPNAHFSIYKGGTVYVIGNKHYDVTNSREQIKMQDFFSRLQKAGFIEQVKSNSHGNPVYQLRFSVYTFLDSFGTKSNDQSVKPKKPRGVKVF